MSLEKQVETTTKYLIHGTWVQERSARKLYEELKAEFEPYPTNELPERIRIAGTSTSVSDTGYVEVKFTDLNTSQKSKLVMTRSQLETVHSIAEQQFAHINRAGRYI